MSPQFLADHIETNLLFKEDRECQDLIVEALKYHLLPERRSTLQSPRTKPRKSTVGDLYVIGGMDSNKGGWRGSKVKLIFSLLHFFFSFFLPGWLFLIQTATVYVPLVKMQVVKDAGIVSVLMLS